MASLHKKLAEVLDPNVALKNHKICNRKKEDKNKRFIRCNEQGIKVMHVETIYSQKWEITPVFIKFFASEEFAKRHEAHIEWVSVLEHSYNLEQEDSTIQMHFQNR